MAGRGAKSLLETSTKMTRALFAALLVPRAAMASKSNDTAIFQSWASNRNDAEPERTVCGHRVQFELFDTEELDKTSKLLLTSPYQKESWKGGVGGVIVKGSILENSDYDNRKVPFKVTWFGIAPHKPVTSCNGTFWIGDRNTAIGNENKHETSLNIVGGKICLVCQFF